MVAVAIVGVIAAVGAKRVDAVSSADLLGALSDDWVAKPETARRVLQRVSGIFEWCAAQVTWASAKPARLGMSSGVT